MREGIVTDLPPDPLGATGVDAPFGEPSRPVFGAAQSGTSQGPSAEPPAASGVRDRLAVVTGASGLLGAAIVVELVARGAIVCLLGRDLTALDRTVARCAAGARTAALRCDLAVGDEVVSAVEFVRRLDRPVDLVVHAAGLQSPASIASGAVEALDEHYLLNVRGPYLLSQQLLPLMAEGRGRFAFVAAADGPGARAGDAHHAITQAAGRALADELRLEGATRGLRVVTVVADDEPGSPTGAVDTDRFVEALAANVVDALAGADLDPTEVRVRGVARPVRTEQR